MTYFSGEGEPVSSLSLERCLSQGLRSTIFILAVFMWDNFQVVEGLDKQDASAALPQFTRLLTQALDFRRISAPESIAKVCLDMIVFHAVNPLPVFPRSENGI